MIRLIRAEWTKLFTTKVWLGLFLGSCLLVGGFAALLTAFAGNPDSGLPEVGTPRYEEIAFAQATNATMLFLILGIIGMTQEYRHRTATPTFLTTPRRWKVVVAKLVAYALASVALGLILLALNVLVVTLYAGARGAAPSLTAHNLTVLATSGLSLPVYALIGVGLGALLRNQVGAIVAALVYVFVVEGLIRSIPATAGAYKWLPGGALEAMTATLEESDLLADWQGGVLLVCYGLAAAVLGVVLTVRRDVV